MKIRSLLLAAVAAFALTSCGKTLPRGEWEKDTWKALTSLIKENGKASKGYDDSRRPYAVFDFDNTSIMNDVELSAFAYQLENLKIKILPEKMFSALTEPIPDLDMDLAFNDADHPVTARNLAEDICEDYKYLYDNYISLYTDSDSPKAQKALKKIRKSRQFKDFRAKTWALSDGVYETFEYGIGCIWTLRLFNGMTNDEVTALVKESTAYYYAMKKIKRVTWESGDSGKAGKVKITRSEGIGVAKEMTQLYNALMDNGFDVYICSASMEVVVEAMACDPKYGFKISQDNVFGLRLAESPDGVIDARYASGYEQPFKEGKVRCITHYIAPSHGGDGPCLVAGDSDGDVNMLTEFKDLKAGLIINCHNGGQIGALAKYALYGKDSIDEGQISIASEDTRYLVQGRNYAKKKFIKSHTSKTLK